MAVSAEHRALHHAIDDLRTATTSLLSAHGDVPAVARLRNDLERLVLDVADADALPVLRPVAPASPFSASAATSATEDEQNYGPSAWDDVDDEGVGGFRGRPSGSTRR